MLSLNIPEYECQKRLFGFIGDKMLEGKCPNCGAHYVGWALRSPFNQTCGYCNTGLEITDEQGRSLAGLWLTATEEYKVMNPHTGSFKEGCKLESRFLEN
jgi:hypothetical protein